MIDWKDTVILITRKKQKIVVPRSMIKYVGTEQKRDYASGTAQDLEITVIHIDLEWARNSGMDASYSDIKDKVLGLHLDMELKVVLGLLRGDKAAEVLF